MLTQEDPRALRRAPLRNLTLRSGADLKPHRSEVVLTFAVAKRLLHQGVPCEYPPLYVVPTLYDEIQIGLHPRPNYPSATPNKK